MSEAACKWDVTVYDRPGWNTRSNNHQALRLLDGERLVCQIWSTPKGSAASDYFKEKLDDRVLVSEDGGMSWREFDGAIRPLRVAELSDGTWVQVLTADLVTPPDERKAQLHAEGLGHLWSPDTWYQYRLWSADKAEKLSRQGYLVHRSGSCPDYVATAAGGLIVRFSSDRGRTWTQRPIEGLPFHAKLTGFFRDPIVVGDVIVGACWGQPNGDRGRVTEPHYTSYCLRSEDRGESWRLIPVGHDPDGPHSFDECDLVQLPGGRIVMLLRHGLRGQDDRRLRASFSDDLGKSWTAPCATPMWGFPPFPLLLRSGRLLCLYTHRRPPYGIRACLSGDGGQTWDIQNEIILRDDAVSGAISYPSAVQLADETVFAYYGINKPAGDELRIYAAGTRFTEDYVRPHGTSRNE